MPLSAMGGNILAGMGRREAGLWLGFAGSQAVSIARSIELRNAFSTAVVTAYVKPKQAEVAVIYLHSEELDEEFAEVCGLYLGLSQSARQVATGQSTINISNLVKVPKLLPEELRSLLPERFRKSFSSPIKGIDRPTPRLWEQILAIIAGKLPASGPRIGDLLRAAQAANIIRHRVEGGLEVFERDAVATVIQAWRGEAMRKRVLREAIPGSVPVASFLQNLQQVSIREDPQITHDSNSFPGMEVARRDVVGSVVLADGNAYLTILNCNRQKLETTLGVDLIYYNHHYESFVLVQYKRMSEGPEGAEYRPVGDSNHQKEIDRMLAANAALAALPQPPVSVDTFRLSEAPFYLKLCEPKAKTALAVRGVSS